MSKIGRRSLLQAAAGAVGTGVLARPFVARAEAKTLRMGMVSIMSGPIALLGTSSRNAAEMAIARLNEAGGLGGRKIELLVRDDRGQPQETARLGRELVNSDGCEILLDAGASSGAFAIREVVHDLGVLCMYTAPETSSLTADPKIRTATAFRSARQGVHDAIVGGLYTAKTAAAKNWTKLATCSPDYAYGRDTTAQYLEFIKQANPKLELITEAWPKLGQPDFTGIITKLVQARPQAVFSLTYAGDLSAFVNQGATYALFQQMTLFDPNLGDYPVLNAIKSLPKGLHAGMRYFKTFPNTPENLAYGEAYFAKYKEYPTNWSWQMDTAISFLEAAAKKAGAADGKKMTEVLPGLTISSPFGAKGKITMRDDHTIVDYAIGWGETTSPPTYIDNIQPGDWGQITELETQWKKQQGYV
jgi:branched-chain amino acid transport system substrate-binding protein